MNFLPENQTIPPAGSKPPAGPIGAPGVVGPPGLEGDRYRITVTVTTDRRDPNIGPFTWAVEFIEEGDPWRSLLAQGTATTQRYALEAAHNYLTLRQQFPPLIEEVPVAGRE